MQAAIDAAYREAAGRRRRGGRPGGRGVAARPRCGHAGRAVAGRRVAPDARRHVPRGVRAVPDARSDDPGGLGDHEGLPDDVTAELQEIAGRRLTPGAGRPDRSAGGAPFFRVTRPKGSLATMVRVATILRRPRPVGPASRAPLRSASRMNLKPIAAVGLLAVGVGAVGVSVLGLGTSPGSSSITYRTSTASYHHGRADDRRQRDARRGSVYDLAFGPTPVATSGISSSSSNRRPPDDYGPQLVGLGLGHSTRAAARPFGLARHGGERLGRRHRHRGHRARHGCIILVALANRIDLFLHVYLAMNAAYAARALLDHHPQARARAMKAIIVAAGRGRRLGPETDAHPEVHGRGRRPAHPALAARRARRRGRRRRRRRARLSRRPHRRPARPRVALRFVDNPDWAEQQHLRVAVLRRGRDGRRLPVLVLRHRVRARARPPSGRSAGADRRWSSIAAGATPTKDARCTR